MNNSFFFFLFCFFFNDTATTEIYTLSLHDALPILVDMSALLGKRFKSNSNKKMNELAKKSSSGQLSSFSGVFRVTPLNVTEKELLTSILQSYNENDRSEEHTSELQSHSFISYAVFCLKKKKHKKIHIFLDEVQRILPAHL